MTIATETKSTRELAVRIEAEADTLEKSTERAALVYGFLAAALFVYGVWAYVRITTAIEPQHLADSVGDIAVGHALDLIVTEKQEVAGMAPQLLRESEDEILHAFPGFREDLESSVRTHLTSTITPALEETDLAIVDEISRLPNAEKTVRAVVENPARTADLFEKVNKLAQASPHARDAARKSSADLREIREHLQKLKAHAGLSPSEQAERKLIQVVLTQIPLPAESVDSAIIPAKPSPRAKHAARD
jgi:hypothetical protein